MCGINGFNWGDENLIGLMNAKIKHRGPDDEGQYINSHMSLGNVRLSIIDLSEKGHQPMWDQEGNICIVHNGEIYNYIELMEELKQRGYKFASQTDTEVILNSYKEWGTDCLKMFNGMWAFCIYDKPKKRLFLSRDRFGIKPLYYYLKAGKFIFSSEIRAILEHKIEKKANDKIIFDYLFYDRCNHSSNTFFETIFSFPPAHYIVINNIDQKEILRAEPIRYWHLNLKKEIDGSDKRQIDEKVKNSILESIRLRLRSDVPLSLSLSGGLDSSTIACSITNINEDLKLKTFSVIFPQKKIDESKYIKDIIEKTGAQGYFTEPNHQAFFKDLVEFIRCQEEPLTHSSYYSQYNLMELTHKNRIKVILDGQGSDEVFCGYHIYYAYYFIELMVQFKFIKLIKEFFYFCKRNKDIKIVLRIAYILLPNTVKIIISRKNLGLLLNREFVEDYKKISKESTLPRLFSLKDALYFDLSTRLTPLLRYQDKSSMHFSVESRTPFLDYRLVEFVYSLPSEYKIRNGFTKHLIRKNLKDIIPESVRIRRDKTGFMSPLNEWLREEEFIKLIKDIINSDSFKKRKYWDHEVVSREVENFITNKRNIGKQIWKMINLEIWLREFIDEDRKTRIPT